MNSQTAKIVGIIEVEQLTALSKKQIYYRIKTNSFPKPVNSSEKINPQLSKWLEEDVKNWINERISLPEGFINIETVQKKTGLSLRTLYHMIEKNRFPKRKKRVFNKNVWSEIEIEEWILNSTKNKVDTLSLTEVIELTGLNQNKIYQKMYKNLFPQNIKIGIRKVAWRKSDINTWLESPEIHSLVKTVKKTLPNDALDFDEVMKKTKLSKSAIYGRMRVNKFPKKVRFANGSTGWLLSDIDLYLDEYNQLINNSYDMTNVVEKTGLCQSTIHLKMRKNLFPKSVRTPSGLAVWTKQDVDEWLSFQAVDLNKFIDIKTVLKRTGLSSSSLYRLIRNDQFPPKKKRNLGGSVWLEQEVEDWIISRKKAKTAY